MNQWSKAPELNVSSWLNTDTPLLLSELRGKVIALHTFQMLCPGCVSHGLPQAAKLAHFFKDEALEVIGLHTVFEHHEAMQLKSLKAFVHEYRLDFPIAIDAPSGGSIPITMGEYGLGGTPGLVLIDKMGHIRFTHHGTIDDMVLSKMVSSLLGEVTSNDDSFNFNANDSSSSGGKCSVS